MFGGDGSLLLQVVTILIAAGAVYGGIRSDLKSTREKAEEAASAARRAHERLDAHIQFGRRRNDE